MKLRLKIALAVSLLLVITAFIIGVVSVYLIQQKGKESLVELRKSEKAKNEQRLTDLVDLAIDILDTDYASIKNFDSLKAYMVKVKDNNLTLESSDSLFNVFSTAAKEHYMKRGLEKLSKLRFDNGDGYFWITDIGLPYPKMIMHAIHPERDGKILSNVRYNTEKYEKRNIYQKRVELVREQGEGFAEYTMTKPGSDSVYNKVSFSKLYEPFNWVVSSGVYMDDLEAAVAQHEEEISAQVWRVIFYIFITTLIIIGAGLFISLKFSSSLISGIHEVSKRVGSLAKGQMVEEIRNISKDELGEMATSLNDLVKGNQSYILFAKDIGSGKFDSPFELRSEEDVLGNELIKMRDNLVTNARENEIKNWSAEGLAIFGDVLRRNNDDLKSLGDEVLKQLIKYLKIDIGALFILSDEEDTQVLEMVACYAYDQKKFERQRVEIGQGHDLVGECYKEKDTIFVKEVPDNYVTIASGLGDTNPKSVVLFPLMNNNNCHGVLEVASLKMLEDHEVEFLEKLTESVASTIESVKVNEQTKKLLEDSQNMGAELREQEEELRQNQEEMAATQEEMKRSQAELEQENIKLKEELSQLKEGGKQ